MFFRDLLGVRVRVETDRARWLIALTRLEIATTVFAMSVMSIQTSFQREANLDQWAIHEGINLHTFPG